jgi:hypothetical protein
MTMSDNGTADLAIGAAFLIMAIVVLVRTGVAARLCAIWSTIAMAGRAIVFIPWGVFLLLLAALIALNADHWAWLLLAGYLAWHGGNYVFGALGGLGGAPKSDAPGRAATARHSDLRKRGLFRRR